MMATPNETAAQAPLPGAFSATLPFGAPLPAAAPAPLPGFPPLPSAAAMNGLAPIPQPFVTAGLADRERLSAIPPFEERTSAIKDEAAIQAFVSQCDSLQLETDCINAKIAKCTAQTKCQYLSVYNRRPPVTTVYPLPVIERSEISPETPTKTAVDSTETTKDIYAWRDRKFDLRRMTLFTVCDQTEEDFKQRETSSSEGYAYHGKELESRQTIFKRFEFDYGKRNMAIVCSLPSDIGVFLNQIVSDGLETHVSDYMYPTRNRQIVLEVQTHKGRVPRGLRMHGGRRARRLARMTTLKQKQLVHYFEDDQALLTQLRQLMQIEDHRATFWQYKLRIQDLLDPSLHRNDCILANRAKANDRKKQEEEEVAFQDDYILAKKKTLKESNYSDAWIPALFRRGNSGKIEIASDIHNLSRRRYPKLYSVIAAVFKAMLPSFEWITGFSFEWINEFRVIVKMMNYEVLPGAEYDSMRHREGHPDENIAAVGIYYYYISDLLEEDVFCIEHELKVNEGVKTRMEQCIDIQQDTFIVFNNRLGYEHSVKQLQRTADQKYVIAQRKLLAFFLVDPKASRYTKERFKTSQDIVVNLEDKLDLIVMHWSRECVSAKLLSTDVIRLIVQYTRNHDASDYLQRDIRKINEFIKAADNEYAKTPKPLNRN